jgi:hypothetical protein
MRRARNTDAPEEDAYACCFPQDHVGKRSQDLPPVGCLANRPSTRDSRERAGGSASKSRPNAWRGQQTETRSCLDKWRPLTLGDCPGCSVRSATSGFTSVARRPPTPMFRSFGPAQELSPSRSEFPYRQIGRHDAEYGWRRRRPVSRSGLLRTIYYICPTPSRAVNRRLRERLDQLQYEALEEFEA